MKDLILNFGDFSYSLFNSNDFIVKSIENLSFASANLALTTTPYADGDTVQNSVGNARDITLTLKPLKSIGNMDAVFAFDRVIHTFARMYRRTVSLTWKDKETPSFRDDIPLKRDWYIEGIISEIECSRFESDVELSINIHCSYPYWSIKNGLIARFPASGSVSNEFYIYTDAPAPLKVYFGEFNGGYGKYVVDFDYFNSGGFVLETQRLEVITADNSLIGELKLDFTKNRLTAILTDADHNETDVTSKISWAYSVTSMGMTSSQFSLPRIYPVQKYVKAQIMGYYYDNQGTLLGNTPVQLTYFPAFI